MLLTSETASAGENADSGDTAVPVSTELEPVWD